VPWTILPASHPATRPTSSMTTKTFIRHMHGGALGAALLAFPHGPAG
jgi:hypothetical protein